MTDNDFVFCCFKLLDGAILKNSICASLLSLALLASQTFAGQTIEGAYVDYPAPFLLNMQKSEQSVAGLPENAQRLVRSLYIYDASGSEGINEASLLKATYVAGFAPSLDGAAQGMAASLTRMDGVKNVRVTSQPLLISGRDARRVSITADRWNGQIGVEAIVVYDPKTNSATQIQLIIAAKKGLTLSGVLTAQRNEANRVLNSVKFTD